MIGQSINLEHLAPLALQFLSTNPLFDAGYYAGDLLSALLRSDSAFWSARPNWRAFLAHIVESAKVRYYALDKSDRELSESDFQNDLSQFERSAST